MVCFARAFPVCFWCCCSGLFNHFIPDVFISTDHYKGKEGGTSPGYGVSLVAQSTAGCVLGVERAAAVRELPEDLGEAVAQLLCEEVAHGGCVDTSHQVRIAITRRAAAAAAVGSAWLCGW